ncbi:MULTISPECIES: methyltransferase domain-containing protein [unclassified Nocardia]|uniref:class I SAM-dependent methyltransferase n=1 Tax=unclassified Nocardia TaxID=2637762 RepID=UPI001CE4372B|nr:MULTISPECIES: methyltransferase domain-containing protein [unclassified Nocardia]
MSQQELSYAEGWEAVYGRGRTAFDVDEPLPWVVALADAGRIHGRVLDAGCGGGHNALFLARRGHAVVGVDVAPTAVARARSKAEKLGVPAEFMVGELVNPTGLPDDFGTAIDIGCFHSLYPEDRSRYAAVLHGACRPGALLHLRCFSDRNQPGFAGPGTKGISGAELEEAFGSGWDVEDLTAGEDDVFVPERRTVQFWYATMVRRPS